MCSVSRVRGCGDWQRASTARRGAPKTWRALPSDSASKAGLTTFARALRESLTGSNVSVTVVHPGHIESRQTKQHVGPMPGLMPVDKAADKIVATIKRGHGESSFPWHLKLGLILLRTLPWRLRCRINSQYRFRVRKIQSEFDQL